MDLQALFQRRIRLCIDSTQTPIGARRPQNRRDDPPSKGHPAQLLPLADPKANATLSPALPVQP